MCRCRGQTALRFLIRACLGLLSGLLLWGAVQARCPVPDAVSPVSPARDTELTVATQNLWRMVSTEMDAQQRQARLQAWSRHIREVLQFPHILVLQEIDTLELLDALAARIEIDGGPAYRAHLLEGNDPSGIDVAVLVRDPVQTGRITALFSADKQGRHWLFSRPPLHVEIIAPVAFDLLALHLRSGQGLDDARAGPRVRATREAQARRVKRWATAQIAQGRAVMLAGDINSAPGTGDYAVPLAILDQPPLWSVWHKVPEAERFSYIYRCQRQAIDHILVSPALRSRVVRAEVSRGNAGRYRSLYGGAGIAEVVSDHDALKVYLRH
jgi:endonuclease/exonuclease/phosphatase family metal-dependent hydrolase